LVEQPSLDLKGGFDAPGWNSHPLSDNRAPVKRT